MSQLVFQANAGGTITLNGENTATAKNLTVPAIDGTLLVQDSSNNLTVVNLTATENVEFTGTGYTLLQVGNTAQRPTSPTEGMIRYNTDAGGFFEGYEAGEWKTFTTTSQGSYLIDYLIVAGGGGGQPSQDPSYQAGYGAGAGGYLTTLGSSQATLVPGTVLTIAVGAGGASGSNGNNSSVTGFTTAIGGGAGGGNNGGSGGAPYGAGTSGQGNAGGAGGTSSNDGNSQSYSGGGGAGGAGGNASGGGVVASVPGNGGIGLQNAITGTSIYYAGGGGGGTRGTSASSGGLGGGGAGGITTAGTAGTANTGGGGGGAGVNGILSGGAGGSGVVILSIPTVSYSGTTTGSPTITTSGSNTILKYTSSGSYTA